VRLGLQRVWSLLSKPDWRCGEDVFGYCRGFQVEVGGLRFRVMGFRKPDRISGCLAARSFYGRGAGQALEGYFQRAFSLFIFGNMAA
jgi:hypothetical protein